MRFLTLILCLFSVSAHAGSRSICDRLLSSSALTSVTDEAQAPKLSASAQAYVNLIQLYIEKSGGQLDPKISSAIFSADDFVNPFTSKESLSLQFSKGLEALRAKIITQEWESIKKALGEQEEKNKTVNVDRTKKETATATVFAPKVVSEAEFDGQTNVAPTWLTVKNHTYVAAVSTNHTLHVYEVIRGQLKLLDTYSGRGVTQNFAPAWQVVNNKVYLAVADFDGQVNLLEVGKSKLNFRNKIQSRGTITTSGTWQTINGRYFLAVAGHQQINAFELVDGKLQNHVYEEFKTRVDLPISWYVFKGRLFLAAITGSALHVFEFIDNEFVLRGWSGDAPINDFNSAPAWYEINGRLFVAVTGVMNNLYLFEFVDGQMGMTSSTYIVSPDAVTNYFTAPVWQKFNGRSFVFVGSAHEAGGLYLFELVGNQLVKIDAAGVEDFYVSSFSVQVIKGRLFVVVPSADSNLQFYEVIDGQFSDKGVVRASGDVLHVSKWHNIGEQYYIAFGPDSGEKLRLVSVFRDLQKQGGRK